MGSLLKKLLRRNGRADSKSSESVHLSRTPRSLSEKPRASRQSTKQATYTSPRLTTEQGEQIDPFASEVHLKAQSSTGLGATGLGAGSNLSRASTPQQSEQEQGSGAGYSGAAGVNALPYDEEWEVYSTSDALRYYQQVSGASPLPDPQTSGTPHPPQQRDGWLEEGAAYFGRSSFKREGGIAGRHDQPSLPTGQGRAHHLPETEVVSAISPPMMLTGDAPAFSSPHESLPPSMSGDHAQEVSGTSRASGAERHHSTPLPRVNTTPTPALFQWAQSADKQHSISQTLLPVAVPSLRGYAIAELHEIEYLHQYEASTERDQALWACYERYLSFNPNHMDMWVEFSEFMIEVCGLERASERIKESLDLVLDEVPLLVILTEMSLRMCDHVIASHYINRAVQLQPENYNVLMLLRDIQRENKLYESASDTEALIQSLHAKSARRGTSSTSSSQLELIT